MLLSGASQAAEQKLKFINEGGLHSKYRIEMVIIGSLVTGTFTREPLDAADESLDPSKSAEFTGTVKEGRIYAISFKDDAAPYNKMEGANEWKMISRKKGRRLMVPYMARLQDGTGRHIEETLEFTEVVK